MAVGKYKVQFPVAEAYGYLVHYKSCQGAKKGKQVASSTKWRLGENGR